MKKLFIATIFANAVWLVTPAFATPPSQVSLQKLAQLGHYQENLLNGMQEGFVNGFQTMAMGNPKIARLNPIQKQKIAQLNQDIAQKMIRDIVTPEFTNKITQEFLAVSGRIYTQEEVDAMINFYGTSLGQTIIAKQNAMLTAFMQRIQDENVISKSQIEAIAKKYQPLYISQLNQIVNK